MPAHKQRHGGKSGRKAPATATRTRTSQTQGPQQECLSLMSLSDELLTAILRLLDWHGRIHIQSTCRRLKDIVNNGPWLRSARFTLNDMPFVFSTVMNKFRAEIVTELDVSHYVLASSQRLAAAIGLCKNLVVLRCVHSRLLPATLFRLVRDNLPRLENLYWSVIQEPLDEFPPPRETAARRSARKSKCTDLPMTLRHMYVEAISEPASIAFVERALKHCESLRSLHFHERAGSVSGVSSRILYAFRSGTLDNFDYITYTCELASSCAKGPEIPCSYGGNLFGDFSRCVDVYKNVTLRMRPRRSFSCTTLAELESTVDIENHKQLTVAIAKGVEEMNSRLVRATCRGTFRHLNALTLVHMFTHQNVRNQAALCNFIRSCVALTELNLSLFHSSEDFNCISVLATGGLDNVRSLALAACALCNPKRLEVLSRASFKLRELDVRSCQVLGGAALTCHVCHYKSSCDDASLGPLHLLQGLRRLTLCELGHARTLSFLIGCNSLLELRLRNMGMWRSGVHQDMSPIAKLWNQLRTLKLESYYSPIDFTFLKNVAVAPMLTRLCLGTVIRSNFVADLLPNKLTVICPAASVIHFHAWYLDAALQGDTFVLCAPFIRGDKIEGNADELFVSPADKAWLCRCLNYIGAEKHYDIT